MKQSVEKNNTVKRGPQNSWATNERWAEMTPANNRAIGMTATNQRLGQNYKSSRATGPEV